MVRVRAVAHLIAILDDNNSKQASRCHKMYVFYFSAQFFVVIDLQPSDDFWLNE